MHRPLVILWPWLLTFWSQTLKRSSLSHNASTLKVGWNSIQQLSRYHVNKAEKVHFPACSTHLDLELWPSDPKTWSEAFILVSKCISAESLVKKNTSNTSTFQDIVLTTFGMHGEEHRLTNAQSGSRTARTHNASGQYVGCFLLANTVRQYHLLTPQ